LHANFFIVIVQFFVTIIETQAQIKADLKKYIDIVREENPDIRQILRAK